MEVSTIAALHCWIKINPVFEKYQASTKDLEAIEEALAFVLRKELNYIFHDRDKIQSTLIASYDSRRLYLWSWQENGYVRGEIQHRLKLTDMAQQGWSAYLRLPDISSLLPANLRGPSSPKISGGLLTPFLRLQKKEGYPLNPYTTRESYLTTILHEFGHTYYDYNRPWCYADVGENTTLLRQALAYYSGKVRVDKKSSLRLPSHRYLSELFAFCTDYTAASIFWPSHKEDLDRYYAHTLPLMLKDEKAKNLKHEDSVLNEAHNFAAVLGRLLVEQYPEKWPQLLLELGLLRD